MRFLLRPKLHAACLIIFKNIHSCVGVSFSCCALFHKALEELLKIIKRESGKGRASIFLFLCAGFCKPPSL